LVRNGLITFIEPSVWPSWKSSLSSPMLLFTSVKPAGRPRAEWICVLRVQHADRHEHDG
jgi:hypothetical protein